MASPFEGLTPELIWKHFEALTKIPRCSKNEAGVARHVIEWARSRGYEPEQDKLGNVVVRVPATKGKEGVPTIVLQGHLDMVGEKDSDSPHDFDKDPIKVLREGKYITADGTTLGADNGIGLAAAMAVAEDPGAVHGPLELLMTVDEETGLTGAQGLEAGFVKGKTLLNLDSEEDGAVYVGCAGGVDTVIELPVKRAAGAAGEALAVRVSGLKGGHSGLDINVGRGNAIQILGWFLARLREETDLALVSLSAGDKHNAIPREAEATVLLDREGQAAAERLLGAYREDLAAMYGKTDPGVAVALSAGGSEAAPLEPASRDALIDLVQAMPHGVLAMSQAVEGLVETSTNLAVARLEADRCTFEQSSRSSVAPALARAQASIFAVGRLAGARVESRGGYPGWQPDMDSAVLKRGLAVFEKLFGRAPGVKAIHAGLECGIIGEKSGGMDMLSFGPQIENPHSPSEQLEIETVERFYALLRGLLEDLAA
jgi:dipeptidase D